MTDSMISDSLATLQIAYKKRRMHDARMPVMTVNKIIEIRRTLHPHIAAWTCDGLVPNNLQWECKFTITKVTVVALPPTDAAKNYIRKWKEAIWPGMNIQIL